MSKFNYGGQAVIEGVMMRGQYHAAIAVRKTDQTISVLEEKLQPWSDRFPHFKKTGFAGRGGFDRNHDYGHQKPELLRR